MKKILVVVDMQNDFITGELPASGGIEIIPRIVDKIKNGNYSKIYFTKDVHHDWIYKDTLEGQVIPPHCFAGTEGSNIIPQISELNMPVEKCEVISKDTFGSSFLSNRILSYVTNEIANEEDYSIEICGVCTDICVVSNALILREFFPSIPIIVDSSCCAGTTIDAHKAALTVMRSCLIEVIDS